MTIVVCSNQCTKDNSEQEGTSLLLVRLLRNQKASLQSLQHGVLVNRGIDRGKKACLEDDHSWLLALLPDRLFLLVL